MSELATPYPYQLAGAEYLAGKTQALLADRMGLGKSCQAIIGADMIGAASILVFCPAAVKINWAREFERFSPMDHEVTVLMTGRDRVPASGAVVCSYDLVTNEKIRAQLKARRWDVLVLDECHLLKSRTAQRTKAVYGAGSRSPGLIARADRVWRLTGTPAPNNVAEMWTHLKSAGATEMPYYDFVARYCTGFDSDYGFRITGHKNVAELKQLLGQFMLMRKVEDVMLELPPISFNEVVVERTAVDVEAIFAERLHGRGRELFNKELQSADAALRAALAEIRSEGLGNKVVEDRLKVIEGMATNLVTLRRYIGVAKVPKVCEILADELDSDSTRKIVVFGVHKDVIEGCRVALAKYGPVTLYGATPAEKRQAHIDRFMKDPKCRVFIGNVQAAGTGITLTSAHEVAFVEASWVPADNAQAAMRCHRIGQTKPVRVRFFSCAGSVDEQVQQTLMRKAREIAKVF